MTKYPATKVKIVRFSSTPPHYILLDMLLHVVSCQRNFGPEKFGPGDQCSTKKNGPPGPTFSWNISPVVEFGSAMPKLT